MQEGASGRCKTIVPESRYREVGVKYVDSLLQISVFEKLQKFKNILARKKKYAYDNYSDLFKRPSIIILRNPLGS